MTTSHPDDASAYALVPADFPRPEHLFSLAGFQPKLSMVQYEGKFYSPGSTPPEIHQRWDRCEDFAQQFKVKCLESKTGKRAHMSEEEILMQYLVRLIATKWTSEPEANWIIKRTAVLCNWPIPQALASPVSAAAPAQPV